MRKIPIDFIKAGDVIAKYYRINKADIGMQSNVTLLKGHKLTKKVIDKLKNEYNVQNLVIEDESEDLKEIDDETEFDEVRPFAGKEIPIIGRIAAISNIYSSLTAKQPYRLPFHPTKALKILKKEAGKKLDPELINIFIKYISPFPKGSTVKLTSGELAIVVRYVNNDKFYPIVKPYMKEIRKNGKEKIIRLFDQKNIEIKKDSKVQIVISKDVYQIKDER